MPMVIGGTTGAVDGFATGFGSWTLINARGLREYISTRFYDPVFYSPNDELVYQKLQATAFGSAAEYSNLAEGFTSTYGQSPAAIWGVGTFRAPRDGGFRAPDDHPQAYITPTASIAAYPDTKSRLMEQRWCQQPPALAQPGSPSFPNPYRFNAGPGSQPGAIFYDGHWSFVPMSTFAADDEMAALVLSFVNDAAVRTALPGALQRAHALVSEGYALDLVVRQTLHSHPVLEQHALAARAVPFLPELLAAARREWEPVLRPFPSPRLTLLLGGTGEIATDCPH
jgi:hypothetical protein